MLRSLLVFISTLGLALHAVADAEKPVFSSSDVFEREWADAPQISPDGREVLYLRRFNDIMTDRTLSHIWRVNIDGSGHEPLLASDQYYASPLWSPDGSRIAYMTAYEGRTSIHVQYLESGRDALIGTFSESPSELAWSPDGETIAFSMLVPVETTPLIKAPKKPEGANWAEPAQVIDRARYRDRKTHV